MATSLTQGPMWSCFLFTLALVGAASMVGTVARGQEVVRDPHFAALHPDAGVLMLLQRAAFDLRYDASTDGIRGEVRTEEVYWLRDRRGIEAVQRQAWSDSPRIRAKDFDVQVISPDGRTKKRRSKDLTWVPYSGNDDGVYHLDQTSSYTVLDGLRIDDLVHITRRIELHDVHGIPRASLGATHGMPTLRSELDVKFPSSVTLTYEWLGAAVLRAALEASSEDSRGATTLRFTLGATAPAVAEPYGAAVPSDEVWFVGQFAHVEGTLQDAAFAAGESWERVGRGYARRIASVFDANDAITEQARALTAGARDDRERIDQLFEHVQLRCRYLGLFDGLGGILPESAAVTAERSYGDCKGLSTLLISMLRSVGIDAVPVLVRTRSAGPLAQSVANLAQFNHFIAWADDGAGGVWLDPTYDFCPAGLVPTANAAWPVLLLHPERTGLVSIDSTAADPGRVRCELRGTLAADGELEFVLNVVASENAALRRRSFLAQGEGAPHRLVANVLDRSVLRTDQRVQVIEAAWEEPLEFEVQARAPRTGNRVGTKLYLTRELLSSDHPVLGAERRRTDLDLRLLEDRIDSWSIELPEFCSVTPDSSTKTAPGLRWTYRLWQDGRTLRLERQTDWDAVRISPEQVEPLARTLAEIVEEERAPLVLELRNGR